MQSLLERREKELQEWETRLLQREAQLRASAPTSRDTSRPSSLPDKKLDKQRKDILLEMQEIVEAQALDVRHRKNALDLREIELERRMEAVAKKERELEEELNRFSELVTMQQTLIQRQQKTNVREKPQKKREGAGGTYSNTPPRPINTTTTKPEKQPRTASPKYAEGIQTQINPKSLKSYVEELSSSSEDEHKPVRGVARSPHYRAAREEMMKIAEEDWARAHKESDILDNEEYDTAILSQLVESGAISQTALVQLLSQGTSVDEIVRMVVKEAAKASMEGGDGKEEFDEEFCDEILQDAGNFDDGVHEFSDASNDGYETDES